MTGAYALSGGGNDFLALVEPERDPTSAEIAAWCARGLSLGADGLFVLAKGERGATMRYWNSDGQSAALCVNGTRCAARLAFELGWDEGAGAIEITTGAGAIAARRTAPTEIALELPLPARAPETRCVTVDGREIAGWFVVAGVPHFVVAWRTSLADCPVAALGAALRRHPAFGPEGTNVDFVRLRSPHAIEIRSFERGVEAETLACGSGVLAAVAAGVATRDLALPVVATTAGGFALGVDGRLDSGRLVSWSLAGDARLLAALALTADAALPAPAPVVWSR